MTPKMLERRNEWTDWWPDFTPRWFTEWLDFPVFNTLREAEHVLRVEEFVDDDALVVRAEMPGLDPDKDVQIEMRDHHLEIRAERRQEEKFEDKGVRRSEFRYGMFARTVTLPSTAKEGDVHATYKDGILEIRVPLEAGTAAKPTTIPVEHT